MCLDKINLEIAKIISSIVFVKLKPEEIGPETRLEFNAYQQADLLVKLEDKFNVPIKFRKIGEIKTVQNLLEYVNNLLKN